MGERSLCKLASKFRESPQRIARSALACWLLPQHAAPVSPHTCHRHRAGLCCVAMLLTGKIMKVIKMSASVFQFCKLHVHNALLASCTTSKGCLWLSAWITTGTCPTILTRVCGTGISLALLPSYSSGWSWAQRGLGAWRHGQLHHCHWFKIGRGGKKLGGVFNAAGAAAWNTCCYWLLLVQNWLGILGGFCSCWFALNNIRPVVSKDGHLNALLK